MIESRGTDIKPFIKIKQFFIHIKPIFIAISLSFLFFAECVSQGPFNLSFFNTTRVLVDRTVYLYDEQYKDILNNIEMEKPTIYDIETVPDFFSKLDNQEDPTHWKNVDMVCYYNVKSITLKSNLVQKEL